MKLKMIVPRRAQVSLVLKVPNKLWVQRKKRTSGSRWSTCSSRSSFCLLSPLHFRESAATTTFIYCPVWTWTRPVRRARFTCSFKSRCRRWRKRTRTFRRLFTWPIRSSVVSAFITVVFCRLWKRLLNCYFRWVSSRYVKHLKDDFRFLFSHLTFSIFNLDNWIIIFQFYFPIYHLRF